MVDLDLLQEITKRDVGFLDRMNDYNTWMQVNMLRDAILAVLAELRFTQERLEQLSHKPD
jgi:hypothetical protein